MAFRESYATHSSPRKGLVCQTTRKMEVSGQKYGRLRKLREGDWGGGGGDDGDSMVVCLTVVKKWYTVRFGEKNTVNC